jgi:pimeloyl-ACP methyl ester carboxylesterase
METTDVDGLRIAYERTGSGPAIVLLHGYVGDGRTTWRRQLDELSDEFTLIAWDAPGAGGSSDPPESFGMADYGHCLAGFISALDLEKPHVVGLSFGGSLALELYRRHPTVPLTLTLASAYAGWGGSLPAQVTEKRLQQALELAGLPPEAFVDALLPTMFSDSAATDDVTAFGVGMRGFHPAGFRALARASAADLRGVLPQIDVRTLLLYGENDTRAPLTVAAYLASAIAGSTLVVLPATGHVCNIESPAEFNTAVRTFLRNGDPR